LIINSWRDYYFYKSIKKDSTRGGLLYSFRELLDKFVKSTGWRLNSVLVWSRKPAPYNLEVAFLLIESHAIKNKNNYERSVMVLLVF